MNKKILLIIIAITILCCSCIKKVDNVPSETINQNESSLQIEQAERLPENFTVDKIKSALLEYINYRLWFYPVEIMDDVSDRQFDSYIDKTIDVEIRVYENHIFADRYEKKVYIHTSVGDWLATFECRNEIVYCDGQISEGGYGWPSDPHNYEIIERYSVTIPPPHKPNYGTSPLKEKMIALFEAKLKESCEDFYKGGEEINDEWLNVDVYIAEFYEYQYGTHAWLCRQDGYAFNYPVAFEEKKNELIIYGIKGYSINYINQPKGLNKHQFERDISDAVRHFKCNVQ